MAMAYISTELFFVSPREQDKEFDAVIHEGGGSGHDHAQQVGRKGMATQRCCWANWGGSVQVAKGTSPFCEDLSKGHVFSLTNHLVMYD